MSDYTSLPERRPTATPAAAPVIESDTPVRTSPVPRLQLKPIMGEAVLDGAWWPRSRDLRQELSSLADHWPHEHGRIARALYSTADWDIAPRRIVSRGSIIPASSFPDENTHKIILTLAGNRRRIEILVIPPDADPPHAEQAFALATDTSNRHTATQILTDLTEPAATEPT